MATKRTGHTGSPRPPGGYPSEQLWRAVAKAITAEAKAKGTTIEAVIEQHFPGALQQPGALPNRSKRTLDH